MARITRKQQKVFAEDATNNGVFGSLQANDPVHSQDPDVIQSRTAYANGWNDATYSAEKLPPLEEFQALQYLFSRQIAYLMQEGIPEWNTNTTYYKGSLVKAIQSDGSFILYASLVDNNQGNLVTDTTKWIITNTSTNFHQGIPNWRADVIYSEGDWVKSYNSSTGWMIYESIENSNLNNAVTDTDYWSPKPFTSEFPLFMFDWFDHELNDTSWLRADTYSWQDGTVYTNAYNHLVDDIDGKTATSEAVGSYTISYYLADDGHKITTDEATVANIYNETGVAWYYVLDTANTRFKLPRENPNREFIKDLISSPVVGNGDALKVKIGSNTAPTTTITGTSINTAGWLNANYTNGTLYVSPVESEASQEAVLSSATSSTYYKGKKYLYFYIGNFSQSAVEQTAGLNAELFNDKMDLDLGNITVTGKSTIVGWGIPDYTARVSKTTGTNYTADTNGYLWLYYSASNSTTVTIDSISFSNAGNTTSATVLYPIKKGSTYSFAGSGTYGFSCYFIPCIGG